MKSSSATGSGIRLALEQSHSKPSARYQSQTGIAPPDILLQKLSYVANGSPSHIHTVRTCPKQIVCRKQSHTSCPQPGQQIKWLDGWPHANIVRYTTKIISAAPQILGRNQNQNMKRCNGCSNHNILKFHGIFKTRCHKKYKDNLHQL